MSHLNKERKALKGKLLNTKTNKILEKAKEKYKKADKAVKTVDISNKKWPIKSQKGLQLVTMTDGQSISDKSSNRVSPSSTPDIDEM